MRRFLIALPLLAAGCAAPPRPAPPPAAPEAPAAPYEAWAVESSRLELRVWRDGPLARFAHDHLLVSEDLTGRIERREPLAASGFALELPAASLRVDEPEARAAAGGPFAAEVPPKDREATARNLLGPAVLDAGRHPVIRMSATGLAGGPEDWRARVRVELRGAAHEVEAPFTAQVGEDRIELHARFALRHAELGLSPFAAALGAISVREDFDVDLRLSARRTP